MHWKKIIEVATTAWPCRTLYGPKTVENQKTSQKDLLTDGLLGVDKERKEFVDSKITGLSQGQKSCNEMR